MQRMLPALLVVAMLACCLMATLGLSTLFQDRSSLNLVGHFVTASAVLGVPICGLLLYRALRVKGRQKHHV